MIYIPYRSTDIFIRVVVGQPFLCVNGHFSKDLHEALLVKQSNNDHFRLILSKNPNPTNPLSVLCDRASIHASTFRCAPWIMRRPKISD